MATIDIKLKSYDELVFEITKLNTDIYLKDKEIKDLQTRIEKAIDKAQLIRDIGFDYDGYNDSKNLKILIDELVNIAGDIKKILRSK